MLKQRLYSIWALFSIAIYFFIFIIPQLLLLPFRRLHNLALWLNHFWAWGFFKLAFLPVRIEWRFQLDPKQQYILCANHFSYLDIPALGLFPLPFKFVGKSQLAKIPLFGLMYNRLHITVNRVSYKSRAKSLGKARLALEQGFNLGVFPEGGIRFTRFPTMIRFQDGAFRLAAECNIPIVPITMIDNHDILPDDDRFLFNRKPCRMVYHTPIFPQGPDEDSIKQLRSEVYRVIQNELNERHTATVKS